MTVEELLIYGKQYIHSDFAKILLAELLNKNTLELFNYLDLKVDNNIVEKYKEEVNMVASGKPIQYAIGNVNFFGNIFYINENVLIPRFETEELVDYTIKYAKELFNKPIDIIDLGTGSGIIGLTLEKNLLTNSVDLVDISEEALKVATYNKKNLNLNANIIKSDMWKNIDKKYDIIISNPPYIKNNESIEEIVRDNEPHLALYAGDDGLDCYRKIFKDIKYHMNDKCLIALEIGYTQAEDIENLVKETLVNAEVEVKKDLSEKDRMIFIFVNLNKK